MQDYKPLFLLPLMIAVMNVADENRPSGGLQLSTIPKNQRCKLNAVLLHLAPPRATCAAPLKNLLRV